MESFPLRSPPGRWCSNRTLEKKTLQNFVTFGSPAKLSVVPRGSTSRFFLGLLFRDLFSLSEPRGTATLRFETRTRAHSLRQRKTPKQGTKQEEKTKKKRREIENERLCGLRIEIGASLSESRWKNVRSLSFSALSPLMSLLSRSHLSQVRAAVFRAVV